jgi:hypothetical protein
MSWRGKGSAIGLAILAAVAVMPGQRIGTVSGVMLAQAAQPADATAKPAKAKPKKKAPATTTTTSPPPPAHIGPPDPGKY